MNTEINQFSKEDLVSIYKNSPDHTRCYLDEYLCNKLNLVLKN